MSSKIFRIQTNRNNLIPNTSIKDLIVNLLKNIVPNPSDYVKPDQMIIWHRAFTHETFDPTSNYEDDEYVGDRLLKVIFLIYLIARNPNYTKKDLTNIDTLVMEMKNQNDLSFELGFIDLIKMPHHTKPNVNVGGDVFESFFGALDRVSDTILPLIGLVNCYNMINYIFNQNIIPDELRLGNSKMIVEQIFIQLGLKNPTPTSNYARDATKEITVTIKLTQEHLDFFNSNNIVIAPLLALTKGNVKHVVTKMAYDEAKSNLEKAGVTEEFIENIKALKEKKEIQKIQKEKLNINMKNLITNLLLPIVIEEELNKYLTDKNMEIWNKIDEEDEMLSYVGEVILKGFLAKHLMHLFPNYNKEDINNIITNIIKNYDIFLIGEYTQYLKTNIKNFFGALMKISNNILDGIGLINCYRMIVFIFDVKLIPNEYRYKHPKTAVEQLFSPFFGAKSKPTLNIVEGDEDYTMNVSLTDEQLNFLNNQGFRIRDKLLAHKVGTLKKQTQKEVYEIALKKLEEYGVNKEWAVQLKRKMEFAHPKIAIYQNELNQKMKQDGYDTIYFASSTQTTNQDITIQLVGVKNGKKTILSSVIDGTGGNKIDYHVLLVKNYLNYY